MPAVAVNSCIKPLAVWDPPRVKSCRTTKDDDAVMGFEMCHTVGVSNLRLVIFTYECWCLSHGASVKMQRDNTHNMCVDP